MVIGIGTDIMLASRIMSLSQDDRFFQKVFTEQEFAQANQTNDPLRWFASHFSGKEAVFKALNLHPDAIKLDEIEILNSPVGSPLVFFHGTAAELTCAAGIRRVFLSLSWENEYCLAFAVAETE